MNVSVTFEADKLTTLIFDKNSYKNNRMNQLIYQIVLFDHFRFVGMPWRLSLISRKMLQTHSGKEIPRASSKKLFRTRWTNCASSHSCSGKIWTGITNDIQLDQYFSKYITNGITIYAFHRNNFWRIW